LPVTGAVANTTANATAGTMDAWHRALLQKKLPHAGCFRATYPSAQWAQIPCGTPPHLLYPPQPLRNMKKGLGQNVGDGRDFTADTSPKIMSMAIGSFPKVKGVKTVQSQGCCGEQGLNSYTLQPNSDFFQTAACGTLQNCVGWSQFVYENPPGLSEGALFIQDWLVPTNGQNFGSCPPGKGWENVGFGCVQNSPGGVNIPNISVTDLAQVVETGMAASTGDSVYLSAGDYEYGMQNVQNDGITDLSQHWEGAEFNIIGNGGGDIANFNAGSTITVNIQADTGFKTKPTCPADSGTTGETNNLNFANAPAQHPKLQYPSVYFTMKSVSKGKTSCDTVKGL
jgi:hypothetical protein